MSTIRIQKNPQRKVRMPETGEELAEGKVYTVEDSVLWRRRIQSGDVKEVAGDPDAEEEAALQAVAEAEAKRKTEEEAAAEEQKAEEGAEPRAADEPAKKSAKSGGKKK